jgi:hypothetical protein
MTNTKITLALLALVAGFAGASTVQAGEGAYNLGSSAFADRCLDNGGNMLLTETGKGCDLGFTLIDCKFLGADTTCEWDGAQNQRDVSRVLGAAVAESISSEGGKSGGGGKKKILWNPDLIIVMP